MLLQLLGAAVKVGRGAAPLQNLICLSSFLDWDRRALMSGPDHLHVHSLDWDSLFSLCFSFSFSFFFRSLTGSFTSFLLSRAASADFYLPPFHAPFFVPLLPLPSAFLSPPPLPLVLPTCNPAYCCSAAAQDHSLKSRDRKQRNVGAGSVEGVFHQAASASAALSAAFIFGKRQTAAMSSSFSTLQLLCICTDHSTTLLPTEFSIEPNFPIFGECCCFLLSYSFRLTKVKSINY